MTRPVWRRARSHARAVPEDHQPIVTEDSTAMAAILLSPVRLDDDGCKSDIICIRVKKGRNEPLVVLCCRPVCVT